MTTYNILNIRLKNMSTNDYLYLVHHTRKKRKKKKEKKKKEKGKDLEC